MNYTYKDAFHCKERFFYFFFFSPIAPVSFEALSWVIISSKMTWTYAVVLHTVPGSLVLPESLPEGVGARCLQDPFGIEEPGPRAWGSSEEWLRPGQSHGDGDKQFFPLPCGNEECFLPPPPPNSFS